MPTVALAIPEPPSDPRPLVTIAYTATSTFSLMAEYSVVRWWSR